MMDKIKGSILMALRNVIDPEVGLDIVTMGLIYGIEVTEDEVRVAFTLTSPGCPLGETIYAMASEALAGIAGARRVALEVTWQPPWNPDMISAEGRQALRI